MSHPKINITNKVITIIAGITQDNDFSNACFIADNLSTILPNFDVKKIVKTSHDWQGWLACKCNSYGWLHDKCPLIWRETGTCGGSPTFIGGLSEFKSFINYYYGIEVAISEIEQYALNLDYSLAQELKLRKKRDIPKSNAFYVTITGAGRSVVPDLVAQLATMKEISENGVVINLYDTPGHFFKIKDIIKDAAAIGGNLNAINSIENLSDGLSPCNVLIIVDNIIREEHQSIELWLDKNYEATREIAEQINIYAPSDLKVFFCSSGPTCFCANVLAKEATKLNKNNIVALSAHYGLEMLYGFIKSLNISLKGIGCPPVWGYLGISQYIDIDHTVQRASIYVPNKRAIDGPPNSTLPLGLRYKQFRWMLYLTHDTSPYEIFYDQKALCLYQVGRTEDFQKCKAICDLLKFWYQKEEAGIGDEIYTLGICSDGSFNIPKGVYFSQPVYLKILEDNSRIWAPCLEFPMPKRENSIIINNCAEVAKLILDQRGLLD